VLRISRHVRCSIPVVALALALALAPSACKKEGEGGDSAPREDGGGHEPRDFGSPRRDGGPGTIGLRDSGLLGSADAGGQDDDEDGGAPVHVGDPECDDRDPCTVDSLARDGECEFAPVVCSALDSCHEAGVCDPMTGECTNPEKQDGAGCDDDNDCTRTDQCQSGECRGTNPVVCSAADQCHDPGVCDPETGECSDLHKGDATTCDDGDACTFDDACDDGVCTGAPGVLGCDGVSCYRASWLADGECDWFLLCAATDYDSGDCACGGSAENITGCDGSTCFPADWLDDDYCDIQLACEAANHDIDDCACGGYREDIAACPGTAECYPNWWLGDGECDAALNCTETMYDRGDCP
jgi:hypothetical protein